MNSNVPTPLSVTIERPKFLPKPTPRKKSKNLMETKQDASLNRPLSDHPGLKALLAKEES